MIIKIHGTHYVGIINKADQTLSGKVPVNIQDKDPEVLYKISINGDPYQEINNGYIELPLFTKYDKSVIIKVQISQMGNIIKTIESDDYPIRWVPLFGNTLEEQFPVTLDNVITRQENFINKSVGLTRTFQRNLETRQTDFENRVIKILKGFEESVDIKVNEGEII